MGSSTFPWGVDFVRCSFFRRGGGLAGRQAVNLVIHHYIGKVQVAPHGVDEVPQADAVAVAVASGDDHVQVMIGQFGAGGHGHSTTVEAMHPVGVNVARKIG